MSLINPSMKATVITLLDERSQYVGGCLIWIRGKDGDGYGWLRVPGGRSVAAHRLACELEHGPAPKGRPLACHTCDNPSCVNPGHLYWGSHQDNARDRVTRGRDFKASSDTCMAGLHPLSGDNLSIVGGGRRCKRCHADRSIESYYRKKASHVK